MHGPIAALLAAASVAFPGLATQAGDGRCLDSENGAVTITGRLTVETHQHPNGQQMRPYVLALGQPVCVAFFDMENAPMIETVTRLQLAGGFDPEQVRRLVNQQVRIDGTFFEAHTAWHITDVLIDVEHLDPAR